MTGLSKIRDLVHGRRGDDANWHQWWAPTGFETVECESSIDQGEIPCGEEAGLKAARPTLM